MIRRKAADFGTKPWVLPMLASYGVSNLARVFPGLNVTRLAFSLFSICAEFRRGSCYMLATFQLAGKNALLSHRFLRVAASISVAPREYTL